MQSQLEQSLKRDIEQIRSRVLRMGQLAETAIAESLRALEEKNKQLAYSIILRDRYIDELEKELDRICQEFLIRQQPAAGHLRFVYSVIKINNEIERIGDYAESIARQFLELSSLAAPIYVNRFVEMANLAIPMLRNAMQAFEDENPELAKATMQMERTVDDIRYRLHHDFIKLQDDGELPAEALPPLLIIASRFERVADQACNICEEVLYMCTGQNVKHEGPEVFRVLFVDESDASLGQMAEGIGKTLALPQFRFSSAGVSPKPIDEGTVEFMASKGIDISEQTSRYLNQMLNLESYAVIVSLCKEAEAAFPPPPTKTIRIQWEIRDPSKLDPKAGRKEAYEKAFSYLESNISDLVQAILGSKIKKEEGK